MVEQWIVKQFARIVLPSLVLQIDSWKRFALKPINIRHSLTDSSHFFVDEKYLGSFEK